MFGCECVFVQSAFINLRLHMLRQRKCVLADIRMCVALCSVTTHPFNLTFGRIAFARSRTVFDFLVLFGFTAVSACPFFASSDEVRCGSLCDEGLCVAVWEVYYPSRGPRQLFHRGKL